jgi:alkylation response protein AidB-like acyl-CoA dehydrogenase
MHFGLSEEQELLQETLRGFTEAELPPQRLRSLFDAGTGHDEAIWRGLAEMGLSGLVIPESHGGAGLGVLELALASEIAGHAALPGALVEHALAALAIDRCGDEAQRSRWLPALASGELVGTLALAEGADAWAPESWNVASDDTKLTGAKTYVPHLDHAGLVIVGLSGGGLAALELDRGAASGAQVLPQDGIDRTRPVARLVLTGAEASLLPASRPEVVREVLDAGLVCLAADAFGAATHLVKLSVDYALDRKQFGQEIARFQAVKHQLARMGTEIEPTRALYWYAAHALDRGLPAASRHAAMAKAHITGKAVSIARSAVELHGGLGFTWECDVQMWFKRAMFDRSFLGTPERHRERMAALAGW